MNKIKKVCVSMAMAVVLLFGGVFSFFGVNSLKAKAVSPEYNNEMVYYFNDAYPSLTHCAYMAQFSDMPFYEYQKIDSDTFYDMVYGATGDFEYSYFGNIAYGAVVIIDIKTFLPDDGTLYFLFSNLKANNCTTALISICAEDEFTEDTMRYIDCFYQSDYRNMRFFIEDSIRNFTERINAISSGQDGLENACIIIDQSWVEFQGEGESISINPNEPFFIEFLGESIKQYTGSILDDIYGILQENNIHLLVYRGFNDYGEGQFIDFTTLQSYNVTQLDELFDEDALQLSNPQANPIEADYLCYIGWRAIDTYLHNMLYVKQQAVGASNLPVYTYERTHVDFGPGGLVMITEKTLWEMYHREERREEYYIIEELVGLL